MPIIRLQYAAGIFIVGWLAIFIAVLTVGWTEVWSALLVPTMSPPFADLRTVQGSLMALESGFNPQINNPGDPWNRPMNYPSVWIWLASTFAIQNESNYLVFVSVIVIGYLVSCCLLLRSYPSLPLLLMCFSGAALLAVERGNNDLLVFTLLFMAASSPKFVGVVAITIATLLKIYPVLAVVAFLRNPRTAFFMAIGSMLAIGFLLPEFSVIQSATPTGGGLSYGSQSIFAHVRRFDSKILGLFLSIVLILIAFVLAYVKLTRSKLIATQSTSAEETLFLMGACIYVGTFILAANSDYRLIFLFFCIPYLLKIDHIFVRLVLIISLLIAMNFIPMKVMLGEFGVGLNISAKIILFIALAAILFIKLRTTLGELITENKFLKSNHKAH